VTSSTDFYPSYPFSRFSFSFLFFGYLHCHVYRVYCLLFLTFCSSYQVIRLWGSKSVNEYLYLYWLQTVADGKFGNWRLNTFRIIVCLSVPLACLKKPHVQTSRNVLYFSVSCVHIAVLVWRQCSALCASGFPFWGTTSRVHVMGQIQIQTQSLRRSELFTVAR